MTRKKHGGFGGKLLRETQRVVDKNHIGTVAAAVVDGTSVKRALDQANHPERFAAQPQASEPAAVVEQQNEMKLDFERAGTSSTPEPVIETTSGDSALEAGAVAQASERSAALLSDTSESASLDISRHVDYKAPVERDVEGKGLQENQVAQQRDAMEKQSADLPPVYQDGDASRQDPAVVVHAQFAPPLSPRSTTLMGQLEAVQAKLTTAHTQKIEEGAEKDAQLFTSLLVDIYAMKGTVTGRQPQPNEAARQVSSVKKVV